MAIINQIQNEEVHTMNNTKDNNINRSVTRKTLMYKTGVEYGDYAANFAEGCAHGCKYPCYAFLMKKRFGKVDSYEDWCQPALVTNALELLDKELPKLKDKISSVQLCFSTDPFMYGYPEVGDMALKVIEKINSYGIKCVVLTKGILPEALLKLSTINEYGITLVSLDEAYREKMEPGAAPIADRLAALKVLHDAGCYTYISMEPYPTPNIVEQDLETILAEVGFVDKIIFGRTNYSTEVSGYKNHKDFYNKEANKVIEFCDTNHIAYHIKAGTITGD